MNRTNNGLESYNKRFNRLFEKNSSMLEFCEVVEAEIHYQAQFLEDIHMGRMQQLAAMREEVLYVIFLDLTKVYNALDRSRCLGILEGYGVGPGARRLLRIYRRRLTMAARAGGYYRTVSKGNGE